MSVVAPPDAVVDPLTMMITAVYAIIALPKSKPKTKTNISPQNLLSLSN